MTVLHTGSTKDYSSNWENIFSKGKKKSAAKKKVAATTKKAAASKKRAKK